MTAEGEATAGTHPADWERLSALADGELPPGEAAALRARAAREPALAAALARIEGAKAELRALLAPRPRRRLAPVLGGALGGALAASLAGALLFGGPLREAAPPDALAWHRALAARQGAAAAPPLNLGSAGLRLARDLVVEADGAVLALRHYQGPNGCRLTHLVGPEPATLPEKGLSAAWRAGGARPRAGRRGHGPRPLRRHGGAGAGADGGRGERVASGGGRALGALPRLRTELPARTRRA